MLKVDWTTPAADDFERNQTFYDGVNPGAAQELAARVDAAIQQLRSMPDSGRHGLRPGTRERVVSRTPYIVVYRTRAETIEILHVFHERQNWTRADD